MTIAEINGKISESGGNLSERMEDLLTSDVFGCFRYLPVEKGLSPFLKTARSYTYKGLFLNIPFSVNKTRYLFWPYLRIQGCNPCEPDVLLGLETDQGIHLIMIEALKDGIKLVNRNRRRILKEQRLLLSLYTI